MKPPDEMKEQVQELNLAENLASRLWGWQPECPGPIKQDPDRPDWWRCETCRLSGRGDTWGDCLARGTHPAIEPAYDLEIYETWVVVEAMRNRGYTLQLTQRGPSVGWVWDAAFWKVVDDERQEVWAGESSSEEAARAICEAALQVLEQADG